MARTEMNVVKVFVAGTMTNWESREMVRSDDEGFAIILECPEGDVHFKFFVSEMIPKTDAAQWVTT